MNNLVEINGYIAFWVFIIGLCIGSFLNVVALRGLSGESIVFPASKCPKCGNQLKWWMNIPLISYALLNGKCHFCKEKISKQYPIVEFVTGLLFLFIYLKFSLSFTTLFCLVAASLFVVMCVCDFRENVIVDRHAYILIGVGIVYNFLMNGPEGFSFSAIGAIAGYIAYEIIARAGYLFAGERAFGEGDSLIAAGIGAFYGMQWMVVSIILSVIVMSAFSLPYFLYYANKLGKKKTVFSVIGAFILILCTYLVVNFNLIKSYIASIIFLVLVVIATLYCAFLIISDMKKKDENGETTFCILPFGPAMAGAFFLIMFFMKPLESLIKSYFG